MIQKIYKGSDILIELALKDMEGTAYRLDAVTRFNIKFFTANPETYIEASYENGEYNGIQKEDDADCVVLNAADLDKLEDGIIHYTYSVRIVNDSFDDGFYDEVVTDESNLYLKSDFVCI